MATYRQDQITFLFICYNEELVLPEVLRTLKDAGFSKFLVMDDHSSDNTALFAKQAGAKVITANTTIGFNDTLLKSLFLADSPGVVVVADAYIDIRPDTLQRFAEFGIIGNYPLLLSRGKPQRGINFSKILRKKYGVYLDEPDFQAVFINKQMQDVIKKRVTGNSPYVFFELIKAALAEDLKIGVRGSGIREKPYDMSLNMRLRRRKRYKYEKQQRKDYIKVVFPGLREQQIRKVLISIFSGVAIAVLTPLAVVGISKLSAYISKLWH
jgi:glycosyltransferase involved in cell wall biosynthesis